MLLFFRCRCLYSGTSWWQPTPDFTQKQTLVVWIRFCYVGSWQGILFESEFSGCNFEYCADCQFISYKNDKSFIHLEMISRVCWSRLKHDATCCRCREEFSDPGYHGYQRTAFNTQIASHTTEAWDNQLLFFSEHTDLSTCYCTGCDFLNILAVMSSLCWLWCHLLLLFGFWTKLME